MTTYGSGGKISSSRKLKTSPKSLTIRKKGPGRNPIPFSRLKKGANAEGMTAEEFVSGINWRTAGQQDLKDALARTAVPEVIEDVALRDFIRKAPNTCHRCNEPIPGNTRRFIGIAVNLPSIGAELTEAPVIQTVCESCFGAPPIPVETATTPHDWKEDLTLMQRKVYDLTEQGVKQSVIAQQIGRSQGDVSKLLGAAKKRRDTFLANIPSQPQLE